MTTPAADRLIFAGNRLVRLWRNYSMRFQLIPNNWPEHSCGRLPEMTVESFDELQSQPPNQTPKQHLVTVRADRRARAQRQKPRLKRPITY